MNPYGDLESIARAHCVLKKGGILFLGIPLGGPDQISNQQRIYGKYRLQLFLGAWDIMDIVNNRLHFNDTSHPGDYNNQPVLVLRKKEIHEHKSAQGGGSSRKLRANNHR